jgi:ferredoxin
MLFSEREAGLVAQLPIKPFTADKAARIWKLGSVQSRNILNELAGRGILIDMEIRDRTYYVLPPPMAGFFEFSLMRVRDDVDQKLLSELFYQYLNVEEDFIKALFTAGETQLGRTFVQEPALTGENALHVLNYEKASHVVEAAKHISVGVCYCRHKMQHLDRSCDAPVDICMTFGTVAQSLSGHGIARSVDKSEAAELLDQAIELNLVQFGENVQREVSFICHCCGCCCEAMIAARKFGFLQPVHTSNFLPEVDRSTCSGCGKCVAVCPVEAAALVSANDPHRPGFQMVKINEDLCLGCGVCVRNCHPGALSLRSRPEHVLTPLTTTRRTILMALERGKLQDLIFDNQVLFSHRALAAMVGVILKLSPMKRAMASKQIRSRYLEWAEGRSQ